jgi:hypothetical protein
MLLFLLLLDDAVLLHSTVRRGGAWSCFGDWEETVSGAIGNVRALAGLLELELVKQDQHHMISVNKICFPQPYSHTNPGTIPDKNN